MKGAACNFNCIAQFIQLVRATATATAVAQRKFTIYIAFFFMTSNNKLRITLIVPQIDGGKYMYECRQLL